MIVFPAISGEGTIMEQNKIQLVAQTLENASNILRESASTANAPMPQASGSSTQVSRPNIPQNSTSVSNSSVQRALNHARNMILETAQLVEPIVVLVAQRGYEVPLRLPIVVKLQKNKLTGRRRR